MTGSTSRVRKILARLKISAALAGVGAASGALAAIVLTYVGNLISGYPTAPDLVVYTWNIGAFSVLGAAIGPPLAWGALRRVPLWRAVAEPALAGIAGSVFAMAVAPPLFPLLAPAAIIASAARLNHVYRDRTSLASGDIPNSLDGELVKNEGVSLTSK